MNGLNLAYGYLGHLLLWTTVLRYCARPITPALLAQGVPSKLAWIALLLLPALAISYFTLGMFSELSALFTVLLAAELTRFVLGSATPETPAVATGLIVLAGLLLYGSVFGFSLIDLYAWGYDAGWFAAAVALLALSFWRAAPLMAWALALGLLAFALQTGTSHNLWDYLIDPLLVITSAIALIRAGLCRGASLRHQG